jgi:hypothetical protein
VSPTPQPPGETCAEPSATPVEVAAEQKQLPDDLQAFSALIDK